MRARVLVGVLLLSVGLTACSDDDPPASTLPSLSATPSESAAPGDVPAEAQEATPEGAAEFVRFFYEQLEQAYRDRDAAALRQLASAECVTCQRLADAVDRLVAEDARVANYDIEVVDVTTPGGAADAREVQVLAILNVSEFVRTDAEGRELSRVPARERAPQDLVLVREGDAWLVNAVMNA